MIFGWIITDNSTFIPSRIYKTCSFSAWHAAGSDSWVMVWLWGGQILLLLPQPHIAVTSTDSYSTTKIIAGGRYFLCPSICSSYHIQQKLSKSFPNAGVYNIGDITHLVDQLFRREVKRFWTCLKWIHALHNGYGWGLIYINS